MGPHSTEEYVAVLETIINATRNLTQRISDQETRDILNFVLSYGHVAYPTLLVDNIELGAWLLPQRHSTRCPSPEEARDALTVIACFSNDSLPGVARAPREPPRFTSPAYYMQENRTLVCGDVDSFEPLELVIFFLHESRHAYHHFSTVYGLGVVPDQPEWHESRTWAYQYRILDALGGQAWWDAVEEEARWLNGLLTASGRCAGEKFFAMSNQYQPALNQVFGPVRRPEIRGHRNLLVAMRANFLLAERAGCLLDDAYRNIVGRYYEWVREQ